MGTGAGVGALKAFGADKFIYVPLMGTGASPNVEWGMWNVELWVATLQFVLLTKK